MAKVFHHRDLHTSVSLQKVYMLLSDGRERSTREVNRGADVECGPTIISELNANGCDIRCERKGSYGSYLWFYRMVRGVDWSNEFMKQKEAA